MSDYEKAVREEILAATGRQLAMARAGVSIGLTAASNAAVSAYTAGMSEVAIAKLLGVDRGTVRKWLGKPRT